MHQLMLRFGSMLVVAILFFIANPYHRARSAGLQVVGTPEFTVLLFDHGRLTYTDAIDAIKQTSAGKQLKRTALITLETVARQKGI